MPSLYETLEVDRGAGADDIKRAWRKAALAHHPDKGGDPEKFKKMQEAYSVLSDPAARSQYDATGQIPGSGPGPSAGGGGMPQSFASVFQTMFAGGFPGGFPGMGGAPGPKPRGPNKLHEIGVSLADLWSGKRFKLNMKRGMKCTACNGTGGARMESCSGCEGRGVCKKQHKMGAFIITGNGPCEPCTGSGKVVAEPCATCKGSRFTEREVSLDSHIEPGMQEGDRIVFPGQCSESAEFSEPGDAILVIRCVDGTWSRRGADLLITVHITVAESLLGWVRELTDHPSGNIVRVLWRSGLVREGEVLRLPGLGMPKRGTDQFGDALIVCRIAEQKGAWSEEQRRALSLVWPEWKEPVSTDETKELERATATVAP